MCTVRGRKPVVWKQLSWNHHGDPVTTTASAGSRRLAQRKFKCGVIVEGTRRGSGDIKTLILWIWSQMSPNKPQVWDWFDLGDPDRVQPRCAAEEELNKGSLSLATYLGCWFEQSQVRRSTFTGSWYFVPEWTQRRKCKPPLDEIRFNVVFMPHSTFVPLAGSSEGNVSAFDVVHVRLCWQRSCHGSTLVSGQFSSSHSVVYLSSPFIWLTCQTRTLNQLFFKKQYV